MVFTTYLNLQLTGEAIGPLEVEFRRDERFMRYLTVRLDKHAASHGQRRRRVKLKEKA